MIFHSPIPPAFSFLDDVILQHTFSFLPISSLLSTSLICPAWSKVISRNNNQFWKEIYSRDHPELFFYAQRAQEIVDFHRHDSDRSARISSKHDSKSFEFWKEQYEFDHQNFRDIPKTKVKLGYDCKLNLLILGNTSSGKTSLITRLINHTFESIDGIYTPTRGVNYFSMMKRFRSKIVYFTIFDLAGPGRFRSITPATYLNTDGIFLVFDVCNRSSFLSLDDHAQELLNCIPVMNKNYRLILLGLKADWLLHGHLDDREQAFEAPSPRSGLDGNGNDNGIHLVPKTYSDRQVTFEEGREKAWQLSGLLGRRVFYKETSSLTGVGIDNRMLSLLLRPLLDDLLLKEEVEEKLQQQQQQLKRVNSNSCTIL